jgi:hypothetical protein
LAGRHHDRHLKCLKNSLGCGSVIARQNVSDRWSLFYKTSARSMQKMSVKKKFKKLNNYNLLFEFLLKLSGSVVKKITPQ